MSEQSEMYKQLCKQLAERDSEIAALRERVKELEAAVSGMIQKSWALEAFRGRHSLCGDAEFFTEVEKIRAEESRGAVGDVCMWTEDDNGCWMSDCGNEFEFNSGGAFFNKMIFCFKCGKRLGEEPFKDEAAAIREGKG